MASRGPPKTDGAALVDTLGQSVLKVDMSYSDCMREKIKAQPQLLNRRVPSKECLMS